MTRTSAELRRAFLDYFDGKGHTVVPSGPVVPPNDPSLMFTNAGMVQFKDVFTGKEQRSYSRACSSQKCIRISGKHNDLEAVGPSPRHHTFFEMLGNFSFGDYFKRDAIHFAWEFLVETLGLERERLIVTYFKGGDGVPADEEARALWKELSGFGDDRVIGLGAEDNFWQMGDTGPCGPSSEIYYCFGPLELGRFGQEQTAEGHGWMEIWNLVFMQFDRSVQGGEAVLTPLPAPCVDTGAGLERLASVVQGVTSNYHTDLLRSLVEHAASVAGKAYGESMSPDDVSLRVIADHARTTAFMIADGILPDRAGRAYVLRRVMRRAIRHGHRLGIARPFLHEVARQVVAAMGAQYPELRAREELITSVCEQEETRFRQTIERGLGLLEERFTRLDAEGHRRLDGADAFKLYDTYGFPLDLTEVLCAERGYEVDREGYEQALDEAKRRSEFKGQAEAIEGVYREALASAPEGGVRFTGYERVDDRARIVALIRGGRLVDAAVAGDELEVITDQTPFYGESGGQVGDTGRLTTAEASLEVVDTQRPLTGVISHHGTLSAGSLRVGEEVTLRVDEARRDAIRRSHSATHLLHLALRKVLGPHAQQKGSLVGPDRLRFDFTHGKPLSAEELARLEDLVNERVLLNLPVQTEVGDMKRAEQRGAMMIFEEKYGSEVRILSMADSVELCGGTHARATGDLGLFKISSEQGVAAGVRRILATTGESSLGYVRELEQRLSAASAAAKAGGGSLVEKIGKLVEHERALERQVEELQRKLMTAGGGARDWLAEARQHEGFRVLGVQVELEDRGALRELAERLRDQLGESVVLVGARTGDKAQLVLTVSKGLTSRFKAGELIRPVAAVVGGSGGGRPDLAQAGGTEVAQLDAAISAFYAAF